MGRPKKITVEHTEQIEKLAGFGLTQAAIASVIGVCAKTLGTYKGTDDAVSTALERGRAKAEARVAEALFEKAIGGDFASIKWWEQSRGGRMERSHVSGELAVQGCGVLKVPVTDFDNPESWEARGARLTTLAQKVGDRQQGKDNGA